MPSNGRSYVYAMLTESERETFERIREQEDCSIADLVRMALNEVAESYGLPNAFTVLDGHRRSMKKRT